MINVIKLNTLTNEEREKRIDNLTQWLNDQGQWFQDYQEHEDNINNYAECFEKYNIHYGELDDDIQDHVKNIFENLDDYDILEFCYDPDLYKGYSRRTNEIWSFVMGEVESQFTGLYDHETKSNCVYTDLCEGLSDDDILEAENNCEYYISNGSIYLDMSYDRISIVLDVDKFLKEYPLKENKK